MSLLDVAAEIARNFRFYNCPAVVEFGWDYVAQMDEPPRVVITPSERSDAYKPPLQIQSVGGLPQTWDYQQNAGGSNPRPIMTRVVSATAHIWGGAPIQSDPGQQDRADQQHLDALVNQTCLSIHRVAPGNDRVLSGKQIKAPSTTNRGLAYQLEFAVEVPIVEVDYCPPIDACSKTWIMANGVTATIIANLIEPDGTPFYTVRFDAGDPDAPTP